jgi:hypothetical protein
MSDSHRYSGQPCQHGAGELAYLDSFAGMVPCTVLQVGESGLGRVAAGAGEGSVTVRVNVSRGGYRRGEEITVRAFDVVPRSHHYYRAGSGRVNTTYYWQ